MRKILLMIMGLYTLTCKAQINIMLYPLHGMELKPSDIFKADIQNMGNIAYQVYLTGTIVSATTGEKLVSARTSIIDVEPGVKSIVESMIAPQYTISSAVVGQTGFLPYGNYRICLKAIKAGGTEELGMTCQEIEITPLSPPLLLSPENQSTISEQHPLLVWLPPMPISKENVVYDLKLVEILPNQTNYDALQRNFALVEKQNIYGTTLQYPANAIGLEVGKRYAWKVTAKTTDRKPIGETEVWTFSYLPPVPDSIVTRRDTYLSAKKELDGSIALLVEKKLYFQYNQRYADSILNYKVYDKLGNALPEKCYPVIKTQLGVNRLELDFTNCNAIEKNETYIMEIYNHKNETYKIKFKN